MRRARSSTRSSGTRSGGCISARSWMLMFFHLYGVTDRNDVRYVWSTFPIVERQDVRVYGRYRSRDLCLAYMNALAAGRPDVTPGRVTAAKMPPSPPALQHPPPGHGEHALRHPLRVASAVEQQAAGEPIRILLPEQAQATGVPQSGIRGGLHLDAQQPDRRLRRRSPPRDPSSSARRALPGAGTWPSRHTSRSARTRFSQVLARGGARPAPARARGPGRSNRASHS